MESRRLRFDFYFIYLFNICQVIITLWDSPVCLLCEMKIIICAGPGEVRGIFKAHVDLEENCGEGELSSLERADRAIRRIS